MLVTQPAWGGGPLVHPYPQQLRRGGAGGGEFTASETFWGRVVRNKHSEHGGSKQNFGWEEELREIRKKSLGWLGAEFGPQESAFISS